MDEILRRTRRVFQTHPDDMQAATAYIAALERALSISESIYEINMMLTLSTSHIPNDERQWVEENPHQVWADTPYFWVFRVPLDAPVLGAVFEERLSEYPENLGKLIRLAKNLNCDFLRLDVDGPVLENLPTWNW